MGAGPVPAGAVAPGLASLVGRLRRVHQLMVDAALTGDGLERVAEVAAVEVGRPVAIVVPELDVAVAWPAATGEGQSALERYARRAVQGRRVPIPAAVELVVPVTYRNRLVGSVGMLAGEGDVAGEASEFLHLAATTDGERAAALVTERSAGLAVVAVRVESTRPREALALVAEAAPGAVAELTRDRMYAAVPASCGGDRGGLPGAAARRLRAHGPTVMTSFYSDPRDLPRAAREAELMLDFAVRDGAGDLGGGSGSDVYRLLFRVLASDPEEVLGFYEDTVAPVARYDDQYRGELLPTLECYLANDCNMNATARVLYTHRHTIAYRLERVKELTGLDPGASEDRERLGLGLKALRLVSDIGLPQST